MSDNDFPRFYSFAHIYRINETVHNNQNMSGALYGHVLSFTVYFLETLPPVSLSLLILPLASNITLLALN
jgi:hypothetical protein